MSKTKITKLLGICCSCYRDSKDICCVHR